MYEDEQYECGKPRMGLVSQEGRGSKLYIRKNGSKAYAHLPSELPPSDHDDVKIEGIDVQGGGRRPVYV